MSEKSLVDTDVLIDYLRGSDEAVKYIKTYSKKVLLSAISVAELYAGVKDDERSVLAEFIGLFPVLPVTMKIAKIGGDYKRDFFKSHNVGLADALIAATAKAHNAVLKTLNNKHFPMFKDLKPPYKKEPIQ
ncbi:MAG: type II toxin-antitoxin system VapC family toxin [Candidatus Aminicenantes bacterium]|jgi:predicted nucleic acid-binding protein